MNFNFSFHILSNCWHIQFISHHHIYCHIKFHPPSISLSTSFRYTKIQISIEIVKSQKSHILSKQKIILQYCTRLFQRFEEIINSFLKLLFWRLSIENASLRWIYAMRKIGFNDCQYKMIAFMLLWRPISFSISNLFDIKTVISVFW